MERNKLTNNPKLTLYSPEEVSKLLGVHIRTIYRYLYSGELKGVKVSNKWRISEYDVINYLDNLKSNDEQE